MTRPRFSKCTAVEGKSEGEKDRGREGDGEKKERNVCVGVRGGKGGEESWVADSLLSVVF